MAADIQTKIILERIQELRPKTLELIRTILSVTQRQKKKKQGGEQT